MKRSHDTYITSTASNDVKTTLRVKDKTVTFNYTNMEKMMEDITFIIFIFATRGSDWEKIRNRSIEQIKTVMGWMADKYGIDTSKNIAGASLKPEAVTVPRIAACFPMKVCDFFHKGFGKPLISMSELPDGNEFANVASKAILSSSFPACIPPAWVEKTSSIHYITFLVAVMNDDVLHRNDGKITSLTSMLSYYSACYRSNATPNKSRLAWCIARDFGDDENKKFNPLILKIVDSCHTMIGQLRANDPAIKSVLDDLGDLQ